MLKETAVFRLRGVLIAAAAAANIQAAWIPILCAVPTNPACWYLALGTTISTVVGLIAAGTGSVGAARADTKKDMSARITMIWGQKMLFMVNGISILMAELMGTVMKIKTTHNVPKSDVNDFFIHWILSLL